MRFITKLLLIAALTIGSAIAVTEVTVLGDSGYPPYSFKKDGKNMGIYVDVLQKVFAKMPDYKVTIKLQPYKRGMQHVKEGKQFAIFPPYHATHREPWMLFTVPLIEEKVIIFGKESYIKGKSKLWEDFKGAKVGINNGFDPAILGGQPFADAIKAKKIFLKEGKDNDANLSKIEAGRIDIYLNDQMIDISKHKFIKRGPAVKVNNGYLGFTKKAKKYPFYKDFIKQYDASVKAIKKTSLIKDIIKKYQTK
jgi:polar amino acid transport system substrate-binding protein